MLFIFLLQAGASNVIGAHLFQASGANPTLSLPKKRAIIKLIHTVTNLTTP